jgi:hypothetical protein
MSQIAFPFLTIVDTALVTTEWAVSDGSEQVLDARKGWIEDWDYARDLVLERELSVDFDLAASQLQLPTEDLELELVLRIATGAGNLPRRVLIVQRHVLTRHSTDLALRVVVMGRRLSHRLRAECLLLLRSEHADAGPLAPILPGARLWSNVLDLRLEGEEPRFPMEFLDFGLRFAGRPEAHAPWYLHWIPGNPDRDFGGAVRLFVNSRRVDVAQRLLTGDRPTIQAVLADVMVQVIGNYLDQVEVDLLPPEAPEGSIAAQVDHWLTLAFPGQHVAQIRAMREQRPGSYHAALVAAADVAAD